MDNFTGAFFAAISIVKSVVPSLFAGLFLANMTVSRNLMQKAEAVLPVFTQVARMSPDAGLSVLMSFADRTAGMAALAIARKQIGMSNRQMLSATLAAKMPSVIQFFVFNYIPITFALFPEQVAMRFLLAYFFAFTVVSLIGILLSRTDPYVGRQTGAGHEAPSPVSWGQAVIWSLRKSIYALGGMAWWMFIMAFAAMLLIKSGILVELVHQVPFINANLLPVLASGLISMIGGVASAGAAYHEGYITADTAVPLLFLLSILHNIYDLFSASLPRYISIYGKQLGLKLATASFLITQAVILAILSLIYMGIL